MEENLPLKILEYQLKLKLAKQIIVFLFVMLLFGWVASYVLIQLMGQAQFDLGRSLGIVETLKMLTQPSQAVPQVQLN